jgi:hypothetical protein
LKENEEIFELLLLKETVKGEGESVKESELEKNSDLVTEFLETTYTHFKIKEQIFDSVSS